MLLAVLIVSVAIIMGGWLIGHGARVRQTAGRYVTVEGHDRIDAGAHRGRARASGARPPHAAGGWGVVGDGESELSASMASFVA